MMSAKFFAALLDRLALIATPLVGIAMVVVAQYRIKRKPERGTTLIWTAAGGGLVFSTGLDSVLRWFGQEVQGQVLQYDIGCLTGICGGNVTCVKSIGHVQKHRIKKLSRFI